MFENLFGVAKEKRTQLFFRDDGKFHFRRLDIDDTFLVEKDGDGNVRKGWKHFFQLQFPFPGLKGIPADMVTLGYDRDIILDPFGLVQDSEKPEKDKPNAAGSRKLDKQWISDVAEGQRYKAQVKPGSSLMWNRVTTIIGVAVVIVVLFMGLRAVL